LLLDRGSIPDVKNDGMYANQSELIRKGLEPVVPASHRDNPVAVGGEASYDRRAEAGGCFCDEDLQFNFLTRGFNVCCDFDLRKAALRCLHERLATERAPSSEADVVGGLAVQ